MAIFLCALVLRVLFFLLIVQLIRRSLDSGDNISKRIKGIEKMDNSVSDDAMWMLQKRPDPKKAKKRFRNLEDVPFVERVIIPAKKKIEKTLISMAPNAILDALAMKMILAGKSRKAVGPFLLIVFFMIWALGGAMFWVVWQSENLVFAQKIGYMIFGALIGAVLPFSTLQRKIKARQEAIRRSLPEILDLLCVSVEAGLSFDAAVSKIAGRAEGPFILECRKMLQDIRMGMTHREALLGLSMRCGVQEVSLFVTSIIQAERLGSNMSKTLKVQADNVRERHRQWVKAMALKAPVKIVLPLVGFILPAIFIVGLGPAIINMMQGLNK